MIQHSLVPPLTVEQRQLIRTAEQLATTLARAHWAEIVVDITTDAPTVTGRCSCGESFATRSRLEEAEADVLAHLATTT